LPDRALARTAAAAVASLHTVDGTPVQLDEAADIEFGSWDVNNTAFTPSATGTGAVRVTIRRTKARGNAVPLTFGSIFGVGTCDVHTFAVAKAGEYGYGLIGLNYIKMGGNATASYRSNVAGSVDAHGSIASNGDITLAGSSLVRGDARPGIGKTVFGAGGRVTGLVTPLTTPLVFPNLPEGDPGTYATVNNNGYLPPLSGKGDLKLGSNTSLTLPGGIYYVHHLDLGAGSTLTLNGPATFYVWGDVLLGGHTNTNGNVPKNLRIIQVASGKFDVTGTSALYASIYAPQSALRFSGTGDVYGSVLGLSVDMTGTSAVYYDLALTVNAGVKLVK
jgi:hypothetical protein